MEYIIILSLFLVIYILSLLYFKYALFFYVVFMPLKPLIDLRILGYLPLTDLFWLIISLYFLYFGFYKEAFHKLKLIKPIQPLVIFTAILFVVSYMTNIRTEFLLQDHYGTQVSNMWVAFRIIQMVIYIFNLTVILVIICTDNNYRKLILNAMVVSTLIIVVSMYFAPALESIGLNVGEVVEYNDLLQERYAGFFARGDVNSLGTFLSIIVIIYLANLIIHRNPFSFISAGVLLILSGGILLTGSRMGFILLVFVLSYFLFVLNGYLNNMSVRSFISAFIVIIALLSVSILLFQHERLSLVFDRMHMQGVTEEISTAGHRYIRWMGFINFTISDITRTLWGSNDIYYAYKYGEYRDPHNAFITTIYINGIFVLLLFLWSFIQMSIYYMKTKLLPFFIPLITVVLISMMIISSLGFREYFVLGLGILIHDLLLKDQNTEELLGNGIIAIR